MKLISKKEKAKEGKFCLTLRFRIKPVHY